MQHLQKRPHVAGAYGLNAAQFCSVVSIQWAIGGVSPTAADFDIAYLLYTDAMQLGSTDPKEQTLVSGWTGVRCQPCQRNEEYRAYRKLGNNDTINR